MLVPTRVVVIDHRMIPLGTRRVRVGKRYDVHGPMSVAYRLFFARKFREPWPEAFAALERDANRRAEP
jgi:hypothetical protein